MAVWGGKVHAVHAVLVSLRTPSPVPKGEGPGSPGRHCMHLAANAKPILSPDGILARHSYWTVSVIVSVAEMPVPTGPVPVTVMV